MDVAWLDRWRWRTRGAWLWPTFAAVTVLDGVVLHALPLAGDSQTLVGGIVAALILNLLAVILLSRPLAFLLRRRRGDMPVGVARNYAGTLGVVLVTGLLFVAGLAHRSAIQTHQHELNDAVTRAVAFIGDRAPAAFRGNAGHTDTFTIQPGAVYRVCVPDDTGTRTYCVIVRSQLPLAQSVVFAGYESNQLFSEGTN